jgi:hypothetical protein
LTNEHLHCRLHAQALPYLHPAASLICAAMISQHLLPFDRIPWISSPLRLEPSTSNCSPI